MRRSWVRLYAPFIVLAMVQALFIVTNPSTAAKRQRLATGARTTQGSTGPAQGYTASSVASSGSTSSGGTGGGTGGPTSGGGATTDSGPGGLAAGDTSHCAGPYQFDVLLYHGPPCFPHFAGDNGGATYPGVTGDTINVVYFETAPNEQVNAILAQKGLATSSAEEDAAIAKFQDFINANYELYGRKLKITKIISNCPTSPPDYDLCLVAAQQVVKAQPFAVLWVTQLYADIFDVWANAGIISVGGTAFDLSYYNDRHPYRWDVGMDGTQNVELLADYYCTKMAHGTADHAGALIHPTIGGRDTPRKLGVIVPEIRADTLTAQHLINLVKACGGSAVDTPFTYKSDINTATQQTQAQVSSLIANKVTTVACLCDPIAPVFQTTGDTSNSYFPEHLLTGENLIDYDLLGQLYNPQQWAHAFGISLLPIPTTLDDQDPGRVWRAQGGTGHACGNNGCGLPWAYMSQIASMIEATGPILNPLTFEDAVLNRMAPWGGAGKVPLYKFGPGDYTAVSDAREVYWDANATAPQDGSKGAYVTLHGDQRFVLGQWGQSGDLSAIPVRN